MFPRKAMILAAGYGKRLKPLTDKTPKALIIIQGIPMIEHVIRTLKKYGVEEVIVNTHYLAEQVENFLSSKKFGLKINTIYEPVILGTGGAVKNAKRLLAGDKSIVIYNTDVLSDCDLSAMYNYHLQSEADITLAVNERETARPLLIDNNNFLVGRIINSITEPSEINLDEVKKKGFCGIHIMDISVFNLFPSVNSFDIISFYLNIVNQVKIKVFDISQSKWFDLGKHETIKHVNKSKKN